MYVLGDFLIDDQFCNAVVDTIIDGLRPESTIRNILWPKDLNLVWTRTIPGSMQRKVLVDLIIIDHGSVSCTYHLPGKHLWAKELTAEVFTRIGEHKEVAVALLKMDRNEIQKTIKAAVPHPCAQNKCHYHKHGEGYPACT